MERNNAKTERKNKRSVLTFLVFLTISTAAWFLVKLSEDYTTQTTFRVQFSEVPADKWIASSDQTVKMSLNIDGFHTLRYKMIREPRRVVTIALGEVSYRQENGNSYSVSSQYVAEKVAELLDISASDITMNEAKVYFNTTTPRSCKPKTLSSKIRSCSSTVRNPRP